MRQLKPAFKPFHIGLAVIGVTHLGVMNARGRVYLRPVALTGEEAVGVGGIYAGFLNVAMGKNGHVAFSSDVFGSPTDTRSGIWAERKGTIELVVSENATPPGTPDGTLFSRNGGGGDLFIDAVGRVGVRNELRPDVEGFTGLGIWSETPGTLSLVALNGSPAPGTEGANFWILNAPLMGANGALAFSANVNGYESVDQGIWAERANGLTLLARSGSAVPGMATGVKFGWFDNRLSVNGAGHVAFQGSLAQGSGGVTGWNDWGIWLDSSGTPNLLVRKGGQAPGTPAGAKFNSFQGININDSGKIIFVSFLLAGSGGVTTSNDKGIWSDTSGAMTLIAREGQQAPGLRTGAKFSDVFLGDPLINSAGKILFRSYLMTGTGGVTSGNYYTIWSNAYGSLALVARQGDVAPGANDGAMFRFFDDYAFNGLGQVAFASSLSGGVTANNYGVWMTNPQGVLSSVVRIGDALEVAPGEIRTITGVGIAGVFSQANFGYQALSDTGELLLGINYEGDGSSGSGLFVASFYDTTVTTIPILESRFVPAAEGGEFHMRVQVQPAAHYRVQDSGDLKAWSDCMEFTATDEQKVLVVPTRTKVSDNSRYFLRILRD